MFTDQIEFCWAKINCCPVCFALACGFVFRDLLSPADEVGEEVGSYEAGEDKGNLHVTPMEVRHVKGARKYGV